MINVHFIQIKYRDELFRADLGSSLSIKVLGLFVLLLCQLQYIASNSWYNVAPQDKVLKPSSYRKEEGIEKDMQPFFKNTSGELITLFLLEYHGIALTHMTQP